jgi:predicted ABC-type ATPase
MSKPKLYVIAGPNGSGKTTLSGKVYIKLFQKMKQHGYELHMFFLWLPTVKLALARVADRVRKGGHDILEQDIRRRFARVLKNLFDAYSSLFDTWSVFDNSTGKPELVFSAEHGKMAIKNPSKYSKIVKQTGLKNGF